VGSVSWGYKGTKNNRNSFNLEALITCYVPLQGTRFPDLRKVTRNVISVPDNIYTLEHKIFFIIYETKQIDVTLKTRNMLLHNMLRVSILELEPNVNSCQSVAEISQEKIEFGLVLL
jgi:hypothetical protein